MEELVAQALEIAKREGLPSRYKLMKELKVSEAVAREIRAVVKYLLKEKAKDERNKGGEAPKAEEIEKLNKKAREWIEGIDPFAVIEFGKSWAESHEQPYVIEGYHRIGVVSDIHFPFHDEEALVSALRYLYKKEIDILILNGDIVDFVSLSKFEKRWKYRNLKRERDFAVREFDKIRTIFRDVKIIFKAANHEERLQSFLSKTTPAMEELEEFRLDQFLRLKDVGFTLVEDAQIIRAGHLDIIHGHEYKVKAEVNIALSYLRKTFNNVLVGHRHQIQQATIRNSRNENVAGFCVGCLCHLRPRYARKNNWQHGFAYIELEKDGFFHVKNHVIENGRVQ